MRIAVRRARQERDLSPPRPRVPATGKPGAPLMLRPASSLGLGNRRPPLGRVARAQDLPSLSRIVLRGRPLRCQILD